MKRSLHKSCFIKLFTCTRWSQSHTNSGLLKLVEALPQIYSCFFSNSIKLCAIGSVTVSLQHLPRYLCSTVACKTTIQRFQINPDCTPKKQTHIRTIKTQKVCVTTKSIWVCLFELKLLSNTDLIIFQIFFCSPNITFGRPFCCSRRFPERW